MAALKMTLVALLVVVVVVVGVVTARPDNREPYGKAPATPYDFKYAVKDEYSGNDFGHSESSDDSVVTGKYYVLLPDGRLQTVTYNADHDTGFVAEVSYEGEAQYPAPFPAPAPTPARYQ